MVKSERVYQRLFLDLEAGARHELEVNEWKSKYMRVGGEVELYITWV